MYIDNNKHDAKEFDTNANNKEGDKNQLGIKKQKQIPADEFDTKGGNQKGDKNQLWQQPPKKTK